MRTVLITIGAVVAGILLLLIGALLLVAIIAALTS